MRNKWIIISALWFAVIFLTFYNASEIKHLKNESERIESLRMDEEFWRLQSKNLSGIAAEGNRLFLEIYSLDLGLLTIDNRLKTISSALHMQPVILKKQPVSGTENLVPVDISFDGSLGDVLRWLQSLKKELPFLKAKTLRINIDPVTHKAIVNGAFFFRYKIAQDNGAPEISGDT